MVSKLFTLGLSGALFFGSSVACFADMVELAPPGDTAVWGQSPGYGNSRGIYVSADTNFSISSLGEFGYPIGNDTLVASIFASNGISRGALLASNAASFPLDGSAMSWNDIPLNFTFAAGQKYVLDVGFTAPYQANDLETFYWIYPSGGTSTFDVGGFLTVSHGDATIAGIPSPNPLIADFRIGVGVAAVPEPETYAMLLAGLGLLGFLARRRMQKEAATA